MYSYVFMLYIILIVLGRGVSAYYFSLPICPSSPHSTSKLSRRADFLSLLCLQETFRFSLISIQLLRLEGREDARVVSQLPCNEKQQNESIRSWDLTSWSHPCLSENWVRSGQHPQKMLGIYHSVFFFMHNESLFGIRMWSNGVVFFSGLPSCCTNEIQKVGVMWHNHRSSLAVTIATCPGRTWWSWK